ncbi:MAG: indole-3-glycerol phosphate synthase TrpC [Chloroflexi bacterium]|nr:indole-3-glycerol phosphate synthase TrpC [Chloroflexota bacterium]
MILDEILRHKKAEVAARRAQESLVALRTRAEAMPPPRAFASALQHKHVTLIAEIKRASPSRGTIKAETDVAQTAHTYADNGASAISVLTDSKYFRGDPNDLQLARASTNVPILRKDFIVDEYQIFESCVLSADAILLIVRALDDAQLRDYLLITHSLQMSALVEIHNEDELERSLKVNAHIIGINNRNLADFTVDLATTERLAPRIVSAVERRDDKVIVAESAIFTRADVERVARVGADAVLVGEALMRAEKVPDKVRELARVKRKA